jgi:hypothetical protein
MKKNILFTVLISLLFLTKPAFAQETAQPKTPLEKATDCVEQYKTLSRLGPGYTREVSEDVIDQFRNLFERDAFVFWDLNRDKFDSIPPPLTLIEYVERTKDVYLLKQPVLDFPDKARYKLSEDNQSCIVYLTKTNSIMDENDQPIKGRTYAVRLRLNLHIKDQKFIIENIAEDKRNTMVRSIAPGVNYIAWDNVASSFTSNPKSSIMPLLTGSITATVSQQLCFGANMDFRLNNEISDGVVVMVGAYYSKVSYNLSTGSYERRILDTLDKSSDNRFTLTVFDRAQNGISEELEVSSIDIPVTIKKYIGSWLYVKGGLQLSITSATSAIGYSLVRSGGDWLTKQSDPSQSRYLPVNQELNIEYYGFFNTKPQYAYSMDQDISKIGGSVILGLGLEKQFNHFSIGIEPNVRIGTNPLYQSNPNSDLMLEEGTGQLAAYNQAYTGLLSTMELPAYRISAGVGFFISYLFKH